MAVIFALMLWDCSPYRLPPASAFPLPGQLSELGLYADLRAGTVTSEVRPYRPSFTLWSDGASKRRWIRLPAGKTIDTSDMDSWRFPEGTELWKEFTVQGKRIETRILRKVGAKESDWAAMSYAWNPAQTEATAAPDGVKNALGTTYDIPAAGTCMACHGGRPERVLGFGAIQLAHEASSDDLTLDTLVREHRLSADPKAPVHMSGDARDVAAIGYLHANCGHCHNSGRPADATYFRPPTTVDFGLRVEDLDSLQSTHAQVTAKRFAMGLNPVRNHVIVQRMTKEAAFRRRMPPLATETLDREGLELVVNWLERTTH